MKSYLGIFCLMLSFPLSARPAEAGSDICNSIKNFQAEGMDFILKHKGQKVVDGKWSAFVGGSKCYVYQSKPTSTLMQCQIALSRDFSEVNTLYDTIANQLYDCQFEIKGTKLRESSGLTENFASKSTSITSSNGREYVRVEAELSVQYEGKIFLTELNYSAGLNEAK